MGPRLVDHIAKQCSVAARLPTPCSAEVLEPLKLLQTVLRTLLKRDVAAAGVLADNIQHCNGQPLDSWQPAYSLARCLYAVVGLIDAKVLHAVFGIA